MDDSVRTVMKAFFAVLISIAVVAATAGMAPPPTATPMPSTTPTPSGPIIQFSGELLDVQKGYVFFSTGDAFKLAPDAKFVNYDTHEPFTKAPLPRMYAKALFNGSGQISELQITNKHTLPVQASYGSDARQFAVALSSPVPNNDEWPSAAGSTKLNSSHIALTGKIVAVRFVVEVPPTTPLQEPVYLSQDVGGWNPQGIRMERTDALHYAVTLPLRTGTEFAYKYTRGSWQTEERGRTGIEEKPRRFFLGASPLGEPDTQVKNDIVYNWADYNPAGGSVVQPGATPTPFNPNPFGYPTPFPAKTPPGAKR